FAHLLPAYLTAVPGSTFDSDENAAHSTVTSAPRYSGATSREPHAGTSDGSMPTRGPVSCATSACSPPVFAGLLMGEAPPAAELFSPLPAESADSGCTVPSCTGPSGGCCGNGSGISSMS